MEGFSQAAENNKRRSPAVLEDWLEPGARVLSGQVLASTPFTLLRHCRVYAGSPPSAETLPGLRRNILTHATANVLTPLDLDLPLTHGPRTLQIVYMRRMCCTL